MMQQGVQKGRFWVTDSSLALDQSADPNNAAVPVNPLQNEPARNIQSTDVPDTGSKSFQKGRFLVVQSNEADMDVQSATGSNVDMVGSGGVSVQSDGQVPISGQLNQDGTTYQQGRFIVSKNDADTTVLGSGHQESELKQEKPVTESYQKGRFYVVKGDIDSNSEVVIENTSQTSDVESSKQEIIQNNMNNVQRNMASGNPVGRFQQEQQQPAIINTNASVQPQTSGVPPLANPRGAPGPKKNIQKNIGTELQRISNQNRKLHTMLGALLRAQNISVDKLTPASSDARSGSGNMGSVGSIGSLQGVTKQNLAGSADPHGLQENLGLVTSGTQNLIIEYNALKSKNHVLQRQLLDQQTKLKEMTEYVENLKGELALYKQKAENSAG